MDKSIKIMICDDSMLIRKKLKDSVMQCCSFAQIIEARDGLEAARLYRLHKPNIVFMDIILPGKNGIDVVKDILDLDRNAQIIMVSSVGTKANLFKSFGAGAVDFIQKPWEQNVIDRILMKYMPELFEFAETEEDSEEKTEEEEQEVAELGTLGSSGAEPAADANPSSIENNDTDMEKGSEGHGDAVAAKHVENVSE